MMPAVLFVCDRIILRRQYRLNRGERQCKIIPPKKILLAIHGDFHIMDEIFKRFDLQGRAL